jgi:hypothetical protein
MNYKLKRMEYKLAWSYYCCHQHIRLPVVFALFCTIHLLLLPPTYYYSTINIPIVYLKTLFCTVLYCTL